MKKQNLFFALIPTAIFSLRWLNCLPFSGKMPFISNYDMLGFWGRYLIFAKEPFSFPLGLIRGLSFPFQAANITRAFPLFAIFFKLLSKVYSPFAQFYYFPLVELIAVFLTALFACFLLDEFKIKFFPIKLLGSVLVSLSFPLLFRSSPYYGIPIHVYYFPLYLAFAYFYTRFYKNPSKKLVLILALLFPLSALTAYYISLGLSFLLLTFLVLNLIEFFLNKNQINQKRLTGVFSVFVMGIFLSSLVFRILGNQGNLEVPPETALLTTRYDTKWGYGGAFGGGFHVADVLTLIIPPDKPMAYLAKLGFPITTSNLQDGQYEGFTYLGTTTMGILLFLMIKGILSLIRNYKQFFIKLRLTFISKLFVLDQFFSLPMIFGLAAFLLYTISWGLILHVAGIRFNNFPTPSLMIAMLWRKFIFARSFGRLAIPFMLFITIGTIVYLGKQLQLYISKKDKKKRLWMGLIMVFLALIHIWEIKGYLKPPQKIVYGNEIANIFGQEDIRLIRRLTWDKKALMVVPELRGKLEWGKICYALAFYSPVPISGATIGPPGERREHLRQYESDVKNIMAGNINEIMGRYGEIALAASSVDAKEILSKTDVILKSYNLNDQDVVILTLDK